MGRRKVFTFGLVCAVAAALATASPSVASALASKPVAPAAAAAAGAAKAPPKPVTWDGWKQVDAQGISGTLSAVGCLTSTHCFGWDDDGTGTDLVSWNGTTWSAPKAVKLAGGTPGWMIATSCPTSTFCMTVGGADRAYVYSGGRWTTTTPNGDYMQDVSCTSPTFCAATSSSGEVTVYNGKTWTKGVLVDDERYPAETVSCASADFCVVSNSTGGIFVWNGTSWKQAAAPPNGAGGDLDLSCLSSTWCLAVGTAGHVFTYNGASWSAAGEIGSSSLLGNLVCTSKTFCLIGADGDKVARYDGAAWTLSAALFTGGRDLAGLPDLSCVGQTCVALERAFYRMTLANTFTGGRWTGQTIAEDFVNLDAVSCPTTSFCAALGLGDYLQTWSHGQWSAPVFASGADALAYLSCPSATFCLAADIHGLLWRYNGRTWAAIKSPSAVAEGILGLSCASPTFCAVAVEPTTDKSAHYTSSGLVTFNGSQWTDVKTWTGDTANWQGISCPTAKFCLLSDQNRHLATFNGKTGRQLKSLATWGDSVSCASADLCLIDAYINAAVYPVKSGVQIFNGRSLTYHNLSSGGFVSGGVIDDVACAPGSTFCVATTAAGRSFSYDGGQWSKASIIGGKVPSPYDVSCASAKLCLAVDGTNDAAFGV